MADWLYAKAEAVAQANAEIITRVVGYTTRKTFSYALAYDDKERLYSVQERIEEIEGTLA